MWDVSFIMNAAEAAGDLFRVDYGMAMLSSEAATAGPDIDTTDEGDYLLKAHCLIGKEVASITTGRDVVRTVHDLKGMRKLERQRGVRLLVNGTNVTGSGGFQAFGVVRFLCKLP